MNDPFFSQFAEACGAAGPLDLRVDLADGGMLAEGSIPMPFVLVGRDDACDVTLAEAEINPRHAWLQVIAGRVFAVDLGSRTGLGWPGGATGSGWMDENTPVKIGPFQLRLRSPVSARPPFPPGYNPLYSDSAGVRTRPRVALEFRNGKRVKDRWAVNRFITLIGRAPECKIHLTSDDIATYHCGLVLTTTGLWVVDLSGRGVVVNGERMRLSPLGHAAELWVGRFLIGVQAPGNPHLPNPGRSGILSGQSPRSGLALTSTDGQGSSRGTALPRKAVNPADDEVGLGASPTVDSGGGFSSAQVGESFRMRVSTGGTSGPVSQQIQVTNSAAVPQMKSAPQARPAPRVVPPPDPNLDLFTTLTPGSGTRPVPESLLANVTGVEASPEQLARQLSDLHSLMLTQSQQSLLLLVQLFGSLPAQQLPSVQRELARINQLNSELVQLQVEVTQRAAEVPMVSSASSGEVIPMAIPVTQSDQTNGDGPPPGPPALHDWVLGRMNSLQKERSTRWQAFIAAVLGKHG